MGDALHPARRASSRLFLMIRFYIDVSGIKGDPVMVAAGYLATQTTWRRFERAWGAILRDAHVREFHATDFYNGRGEFKGWDVKGERHVRFAKRFTGAAAKYPHYGVGFGVELSAFDEELGPTLEKSRTPHRRYTPAMFCVANCLRNAARDLLGPSQEVATVILEGGEGVGEIIDHLYFLKSLGRGWVNAYVSFAQMPKCVRPLQAADLLAHEQWRLAKERLNPQGRAVRKSYSSLARHERLGFAMATRANLRASVPGILAFLDRNPEYGA